MYPRGIVVIDKDNALAMIVADARKDVQLSNLAVYLLAALFYVGL